MMTNKSNQSQITQEKQLKTVTSNCSIISITGVALWGLDLANSTGV
jgi:plastocyanin domain-containing protein